MYNLAITSGVIIFTALAFAIYIHFTVKTKKI